MKYALIGCGAISPNHIKAALANGLKISALCDIVEANFKRILEFIPEDQQSQVKLYTDYQQMLDELKPQLVAIALGSGIKKKIALDCMKAGANIIMEKPLSLSLAEADEMIAASLQYGVKLCANHQLRFGTTVRAVKKQVESGNFGKLLHSVFQVRRNRNKAYFEAAKWRGTWAQDGGTLMNQCIHYADLLLWFMGSEVEEVFAYTDRLIHPYIEAEDLGLALVKFKNGAYGMLEGTVNVYPKNLSDSMALFGETGTVSLNGKTLDEVLAWDFQDAPQSRDEALEHYGINDLGSGHVALYADVIESIKNDRPLFSPAEDGRKAVELVLAIYKSAAEGQPVKLPLANCATIDFKGRFH